MGRSYLERLSKEELIELVLRLQRPEKTSRTSSKPPATDRKEQRDQAKPGGAKPGHEGHSRVVSDDPDEVVEHRPDRCPCCGGSLPGDLPAEVVSTSERIELPEIAPVVTQHRRLALRCPCCGTHVVAPVPKEARGTPFGPRLHTVATYLKTFQALSYERLQAALSDLFGLTLSQGGLMNLLRRAQARFQPGREAAISALRRAEVVASDETGVRIEGCNAYHSRLPLRGGRRPSGLANARRLGGAGDDGRAPACGLDLGPLHGPTGTRGRASDLPRASGPRCRLCRRGQRRSRALSPAALAAIRVRAR
jgi:transposase